MPHSTAEAGERPSGPCGAKGVPRCGRERQRLRKLRAASKRGQPVKGAPVREKGIR